MQTFSKKPDPDRNDHFKAITVKQPFADALIDGMRIVLREKPTEFRGVVVVCSSYDVMPGIIGSKHYKLGRTICVVEIKDCVKVSDMSPSDWRKHSKLSLSDKTKYKHTYALIIDYHRALVNIPVLEKKGIWNLTVKKGSLICIESIENEKYFPISTWTLISVSTLIILMIILILTI